MSLRRRVLVGFLTVAAVLVITNLALSSTFRSFLIDRLDRQLIDVASRPVFGGDRGRAPGPPPGESQTFTEYFIAVGDRNATNFSRRSRPSPTTTSRRRASSKPRCSGAPPGEACLPGHSRHRPRRVAGPGAWWPCPARAETS